MFQNKIIGFTGTQKGMNEFQLVSVKNMLSHGIKEVHHGDCIGADSDFHDVCHMKGLYIVIHPPVNDYKRAFKKNYGKICEEKEYLDRNKDIVNCCDVLIATPGENKEQLRSGTWATIRYAKKRGKSIHIIFPNNHIEIIQPKAI